METQMGIYYYYQQQKIGPHIEKIGNSCFRVWVDDTFIGAFGDCKTAKNAIASYINERTKRHHA